MELARGLSCSSVLVCRSPAQILKEKQEKVKSHLKKVKKLSIFFKGERKVLCFTMADPLVLGLLNAMGLLGYFQDFKSACNTQHKHIPQTDADIHMHTDFS